MPLSPEEEQKIFTAVYQDRNQFLQANSKSMNDLESWRDSLLKQKPLTDHHAISLRATAQAYEDEIKRQKTLKLISQ